MSQLIKHSNPTIKKKDLENVLNCLVTDYIAAGSLTSEFENKLKEYLNVKYGVAVSSAEAGLHLILEALEVGEGDEIILPSYYYTPALNVINYVNAKPVLVDIDESGYHISLEDVKSKITDNTKAIIIPHIFGLAVDIEPFLKLGPKIIEDCGHSLGARIYEDSANVNGDNTENPEEIETQTHFKKTGSFGDFAIFSFYATRMITTGEGGFVVSKTKKNLDLIKDLIEYDERDDYKIRYSYKLSDMQSSLGIRQVDLLDYFINVRREIAQIYNKELLNHNRKIPEDFPNRPNIYYRYPVKIKIPVKEGIELYKNQGIEAKKPVYKPLHHYLGLDKNGFPNTEEVYKTTISVPIYPTLQKSQVELIAKVITKI